MTPTEITGDKRGMRPVEPFCLTKAYHDKGLTTKNPHKGVNMRSPFPRRNKLDTQCIAVKYIPGFTRQQYIGALFRQIRDIENGILRDLELQ